MKKSKTHIEFPKHIVFRETFNSEAEINERTGVVTNVTLSNGIATPSSGNIVYERRQLPQGAFSIRSVFKADLSSNGTLFADSYDTNKWTRLKINTNGSMSLYNDNAGSSISSLGIITTNTWHDVVITNDFSGSSNIKFYVDGELMNTNSQTSVWGNFNRLFDRGDGAADFFVGEVGLFEIYNYVLSAEEISNLYNNRRFQELIGQTEILNVSAQSGTIIDRWGATITNTAGTISRDGEANVMLFDGATSKLTLDDEIIGTGAVSLVAWVKPLGIGEGAAGRIMTNDKAIFAITDPTNKQFVFSSDGYSTWKESANGAWVTGEWCMAVVTRTAAGVANIYVNGVLNGTANEASGTPVAGTTNLILGNNNAGGTTFDGYQSDYRIYSGILTAVEISQLYTSEKRKYHG